MHWPGLVARMLPDGVSQEKRHVLGATEKPCAVDT